MARGSLSTSEVCSSVAGGEKILIKLIPYERRGNPPTRLFYRDGDEFVQKKDSARASLCELLLKSIKFMAQFFKLGFIGTKQTSDDITVCMPRQQQWQCRIKPQAGMGESAAE
jgi:hypothetical protein